MRTKTGESVRVKARPEALSFEDIADVEIFQAGEWNGQKFTDSDLQEIVEAYNGAGDLLKPYLKLGHDDKQTLLQRDGLPSAGWITGLRKAGDKILASFVDVPSKVAELIKRGGYKRVSSEIYLNYKDALGNVWPKALKAVALLGGDTPAVTTLNDLLAMYADKKEVETIRFEMEAKSIKEEEMEIEEKKEEEQEVKEEEAREEVKEEESAFAEEKKVLEAEIEKLKADALLYTEAKSKLDAIVAEQKKQEAIAFCDKMLTECKITPAQRESLEAVLLSAKEAETVVKFAEGKESSLYDSLKSVIESYPSSEMLKEFSTTQKKIEAEDREAIIKTFAKENGVSYGVAQIEVIRSRPELFPEYQQ